MKKTIITITILLFSLAGYSQCEICFSLLRTPAGVIIKKQSQPWTFQTSAAETQLVINALNISAGGSVTIKWGDGTQNAYTGDNSGITKNYAVSGQYTVKVYFSDFTKVTNFRLFSEAIIDDISEVGFGNLTNLTSLQLQANSLTGSIPTELGNLTNLTRLWLYDNSLSGIIPAELGNLTNLTSLWLYSNSLTGSIPAELGNLTNLTTLYILNNSLTGSIPAELGNLTNLTTLWLYSNSLTYLEDISGAKNITIARFYDNDITGIDSVFIPNNATDWRFDGNLMPSAEVNEIFEDADASITVPTANLTLNTSGAGMGALPDGAANAFLTSLTTKYSNASIILTAIYNTP